MFTLTNHYIVTWTDEVTNQKRFAELEDAESIKEVNSWMKAHNHKKNVRLFKVDREFKPTGWSGQNG